MTVETPVGLGSGGAVPAEVNVVADSVPMVLKEKDSDEKVKKGKEILTRMASSIG